MSTAEGERDNIALVKKGFEAFAKGDMAALGELFDPNAQWHAAPTGILKGDYRGRDAVFASFALLHKETNGTFRSEPIVMAAAGDKVFVQTHASGQRGGKTLSDGEVLVFKLLNGHLTEVKAYFGDHAARVKFWS